MLIVLSLVYGVYCVIIHGNPSNRAEVNIIMFFLDSSLSLSGLSYLNNVVQGALKLMNAC